MTWSQGICRKHVASQSYLVECKGAVYRRNHKHIRKTGDKVLAYEPDIDMIDSDSEIGEEREGEPESANSTATDARANNVLSSAQATKSHPQRTSSFGRTLKPPKRFVEHNNMIN